MRAEDGEEGWHPPEGRTGLDLLLRRKKLLVLWMEQNPKSTLWCLVRLNPGPGPAAISTLGPLSVCGQWTRCWVSALRLASFSAEGLAQLVTSVLVRGGSEERCGCLSSWCGECLQTWLLIPVLDAAASAVINCLFASWQGDVANCVLAWLLVSRHMKKCFIP